MIDYDAPGVCELMADTRDCIERGSLRQVEVHESHRRLGEATLSATIAMSGAVSAYIYGYDSELQSSSEAVSQGVFFAISALSLGSAVLTAKLLISSAHHRFKAWSAV